MSESKTEVMTRLEREVVSISELCRGLIAADRLECVIDLAHHDECGVGLEILCENLQDDAAGLDDLLLHRIERARTELGLDPRYWRPLRRNA